MRVFGKIAGILGICFALLSGGVAQAAGLTVDVNHLMVSLTPENKLQVSEQYTIQNPEAPFTGEDTLRLTLPQGYLNLELGTGIDGEKARTEGQEVILSQEIPTGSSSYSLVYQLDMNAGAPHYLLTKKIQYPTQTFYVIGQAGAMQLISQVLEDQGITAMGDRQFQIYAAGNLEPEMLVDMVVTPGTGEAGGDGSTVGPVSQEPPAAFHNPGHIRLWKQSPFSGMDAHLFLFIVVGLPLGALFWYLVKRKKLNPAAPSAVDEEEVFQRLLLREKSLKQKLVELENQFTDGAVSEEEYHNLRDVYKRKLVEVRAKIKSFTE